MNNETKPTMEKIREAHRSICINGRWFWGSLNDTNLKAIEDAIDELEALRRNETLAANYAAKEEGRTKREAELLERIAELEVSEVGHSVTKAALAGARMDINALTEQVQVLTKERDEARNSLAHKERLIDSIWAGESGAECAECERLTANGICTECRHGTSPLKKAEKQLDAARAEAARLREALVAFLEVSRCSNGCPPDDMTCATSRADAALAATDSSAWLQQRIDAETAPLRARIAELEAKS